MTSLRVQSSRRSPPGRGFDGGYVHLDLRHLGEKLIRERLPGIRLIAMDFAGIDPITEPIPVQPAQHYSMGGISGGIEGRSSLPGLYAAGECGCVSVHGANRLGGNSLLETVVFGRLAADAIVRDIVPVPVPAPGPVLSAMRETEGKITGILERNGGEPLFPVIDSLKETMYTKFGIFREGDLMTQGLDEIRKIRAKLGNISISDKGRAANQALDPVSRTRKYGSGCRSSGAGGDPEAGEPGLPHQDRLSRTG